MKMLQSLLTHTEKLKVFPYDGYLKVEIAHEISSKGKTRRKASNKAVGASPPTKVVVNDNKNMTLDEDEFH